MHEVLSSVTLLHRRCTQIGPPDTFPSWPAPTLSQCPDSWPADRSLMYSSLWRSGPVGDIAMILLMTRLRVLAGVPERRDQERH